MHLIHGQWDFEWQHVEGNQQQNFWRPGRNYLDTTVWTFRKIQLINQQPTHLKSFTKTPAALGLVMGDFQKCQRLSSVRVLAPWTWNCIFVFFSTKIFSEDIGNQALLHEDHPDLSRSNGKNTALDINRKVKAGTWIQSFLTNRTFSSLGKWIKNLMRCDSRIGVKSSHQLGTGKCVPTSPHLQAGGTNLGERWRWRSTSTSRCSWKAIVLEPGWTIKLCHEHYLQTISNLA